AGAVMRSILDGTPLPASLLPAAIVRIKAERDITYPRAKLIKAFLNRNHERKLTVSLDKNNTDVGYRLGRLFAVLEKIQLAANPGINATIRDRFYASASATPAAVFGNLMRLSGHHLSKLDADKKGLRIWLEKQVEEIVSGLSAFPPHLSLEEQGMFAIGYYHQRNAKKDETPADAAAPATV
ncbi:MAG: type I-C CRISPR-associated protein Cas8c/Csd1, partial [Kiritimatiellae bacterium]|nr:type I-C CRISPR-associated protein Cas8c/Csd1 [Kiritimatiellia bacterium]